MILNVFFLIHLWINENLKITYARHAIATVRLMNGKWMLIGIVGHLSKIVHVFVCIHAYAVEKNDMNSSRVHTYTGTPYGRIWGFMRTFAWAFFFLCLFSDQGRHTLILRSLWLLSLVVFFSVLCELSSDISKCVLFFCRHCFTYFISYKPLVFSLCFFCVSHSFLLFNIAFVYHKHKRMRLSFFVHTLYSRKIFN